MTSSYVSDATNYAATVPEDDDGPKTPEEILQWQWDDFKFHLLNLADWISVHAASQGDFIARVTNLYNDIGGTTDQYLISNEQLSQLQTDCRLYQIVRREIVFGISEGGSLDT